MLFGIGDTVRVKRLDELEACCADIDVDDLRFDLGNGYNAWFESGYRELCGREFVVICIDSIYEPRLPDLLTFQYVLSDGTCDSINEEYDFFGCELFLELVKKAPAFDIATKPLFDAVFGGDDE